MLTQKEKDRIEMLAQYLSKNIDFKNVDRLSKAINLDGVNGFFENFFSGIQQNESSTEVTLQELIQKYQSLIFSTFMHKSKKTTYLLLDIFNVQTTDNVAFPVMVSYFDKKLKTTWCRPLVEFNDKFILLNK